MKSRGTIFLVDDDDALRRATQRLLQACGFQVRAFASAEAFLRAFDHAEPGCILLDLRMQGLSGLELQQLLLDRGTSPPIVFFTGHADEAAREHALEKGAVAFLKKPVREESLIEALERALAKDALDRHADPGSTSLQAAT
ncbi:MAG: response regulator [Planctomycetes bacterium]|nr:response regulator [Planctomycetota bacterium]